MLPKPQRSAHVAEGFRLLEALHPGRIDLGIVGSGAPTESRHLRCAGHRSTANEFPNQLAELLRSPGVGSPTITRFRHRLGGARRGRDLPPVWILGSSDFGAQVAAAYGLRFGVCALSNPRGAADALRPVPRTLSTVTRQLRAPAMLTVSAIAADTPERAEELALSLGSVVVRMRQGRPGKLPSPQEPRRTNGPRPSRINFVAIAEPRPWNRRAGARCNRGARRRDRRRRDHGHDIRARSC